MKIRLLLVASALILLAACHPERKAEVPVFGELREINVPAAPGSAQPHLSTASDGSALLSWLERAPESSLTALKFAHLRGGRWSKPQTIIERDDLFVNWADFPSVVAAGPTLFAHWLQKSGKGVYAYDVRVAASRDGGSSWTSSWTPHRDGTQTEHGFVSMVPLGESVGAIWLDGRNMKEGHGDHGSMTLRFAVLAADGSVSGETELDDRACECCQTGMTASSEGLVAVYRDRSEEEIRDISVVRRNGKTWSRPVPLHADGWKIEGCPVNGPQIDSRGAVVVVSWFSGANGANRVYTKFSQDSGASFGAPIATDTGSPLGRVDVLLLPDNSALVSWIEQVGTGAEVSARRVRSDGSLDEPLKVATSSPARSAGVPRMSYAEGAVVFAWTETGDPLRIRTSVLPWNRG